MMEIFRFKRTKKQRKLLEQFEITNREMRPERERREAMIYALDEEQAYLDEEIREFNKQYPEDPYSFGNAGHERDRSAKLVECDTEIERLQVLIAKLHCLNPVVSAADSEIRFTCLEWNSLTDGVKRSVCANCRAQQEAKEKSWAVRDARKCAGD